MTDIDISTGLGALVTRHPELARELERRQLDYCCGGARSLGDACRERGLDPAAVIADLGDAVVPGPEPDWATMDAAALVDHLEATHHAYLWEELPRLQALVDKVHAVHGERHPELERVATLFGATRADLEPHLIKEERVLFPMIRELAAAPTPGTSAPAFHCGSLRNPISVMLSEHDRVGELLEAQRTATGGYAVPADGCASFRALYEGLEQLERDTHLHVHKENNLLFPMVVAMEAGSAARSGPARR